MTDEETNKKLDTLIDLLTPKAIDPNAALIKTAEGVLREALKDQFPQEKLDAWDLDHLKMAQEVHQAKALPDPIGKTDTVDKKPEEEAAPETPKEDANIDPFKYASRTYDKEVSF